MPDGTTVEVATRLYNSLGSSIMNSNKSYFHPRALRRSTHFALWLHIFGIVCSCALSVYLIYAGCLSYLQLHALGVAFPANGFYLIFGGILLLVFSLWRLSRAIYHLKKFRAEYEAHIQAAR
jgi:hypothetical protein